MEDGKLELHVLVGDRPIKEWGISGKTYVEGRKGKSYTLKFVNRRAERVLVVPSIDGLSVLDGLPANKDSRGYLVEGYSNFEIKGWRTSLAETRRFEFGGKDASYAGKTAGTANCGVIGCLVYAERPEPLVEKRVEHIHHYHDDYPEPLWPHKPWHPWKPYRYHPYEPVIWGTTTLGTPGDMLVRSVSAKGMSGPVFTCSMADNSSAPRASMNMSVDMAASIVQDSAADYNLGTVAGQAQKDEALEVDFKKGRKLALLEIYYTDAEGLAKAGIDVNKQAAVSAHPQSFGGGFCKIPQ